MRDIYIPDLTERYPEGFRSSEERLDEIALWDMLENESDSQWKLDECLEGRR